LQFSIVTVSHTLFYELRSFIFNTNLWHYDSRNSTLPANPFDLNFELSNVLDVSLF